MPACIAAVSSVVLEAVRAEAQTRLTEAPSATLLLDILVQLALKQRLLSLEADLDLLPAQTDDQVLALGALRHLERNVQVVQRLRPLVRQRALLRLLLRRLRRIVRAAIRHGQRVVLRWCELLRKVGHLE